MAERQTYELIVEPREVTGKHVKRLRRQHLVPAVVYGYGVTARPLQADQKEFDHVYLRAGSNSLVDLKVGQGDEPRKVFIHAVQRNPITHDVEHVDFLAVNLREETTTTVPLVLVGVAPATRTGEGTLLQQLDHVQIRALPADIPSQIEVDVSGLAEVDQAIHVSDLEMPENVQLLTHEDEMVAKIAALRVEAVEEAEEAAEGEEAEEGAAEGGAEAEEES
ncbi:MAG: 50S ribosomal protein L25 [Chloroflexia bacterium]